MRILPVAQYNNKINFKSSISTNPNISLGTNNNEENNNNRPQNKPLPEWARKAMLFTLLFVTFKNEPVVQNFFHSDTRSEKEIDRDEFFEDVEKIRKDKEKSPAFYHLNRLYDIEQPQIESLGNDKYALKFNLDKQKIQLTMQLDKNNKDTITGTFRTDKKGSFTKYKAIFSPDNIHEFKLLINNNGEKYILGRDYKGELYKIENNKKQILNNENVEKYEQYLKSLETADDLKFFTNANPLWRKLNYLLLLFLVYNEYRHDKNRRKEDSDNKDI